MGWRQGRSIKDTHADSLYGIPSQLTFCLFAFHCVVFLSFVFYSSMTVLCPSSLSRYKSRKQLA